MTCEDLGYLVCDTVFLEEYLLHFFFIIIVPLEHVKLYSGM